MNCRSLRRKFDKATVPSQEVLVTEKRRTVYSWHQYTPEVLVDMLGQWEGVVGPVILSGVIRKLLRRYFEASESDHGMEG